MRGRLGAALVGGGGAALRAWLLASYRPGFLGYPDARTYVIAARGPLFWNPYRPAGYALFLRALRRLDSRLTVTIAAQHALGVVTASLLRASCLPYVRRRWVARLPAAVVLYGGAQLFLEHSVLSEGPYTFLLTTSLWSGLRSMRSSRPLPWLMGAGAAIGASATMRSPGVAGVPVIVVWAGSGPPARPGERRRCMAAVISGAGAILVPYVLAQHSRTGTWGLTRSTGFTLYARVATFADCNRFNPPAGTAGLCESKPLEQRPSPTWYMFGWPDAPALRLFGVPPYPLSETDRRAYRWSGEGPLLRFAVKVLVNQPWDYLRTTALALAGFAAPHTGPPSVTGWDHNRLMGELHEPGWERESVPCVTEYYSTGAGYVRNNVEAIDSYARAAKLEGLPTTCLAALALIGCTHVDRRTRRASSLLGGTAACGAITTAALLFYDARYAAPLYGPLGAAAAIGLDRLLG